MMRVNSLLGSGLAMQAFSENYMKNDALPNRAPKELEQRFYPHGLPFPRQRLSDAFPQMQGQREQWLDYNGSFVATDPKALPAGGQRLSQTLTNDAAQLFFLADMGDHSQQQADVFQALKAQLKQDEEPGGTDNGQPNAERPIRPNNGATQLVVGGGDWAYPHGPENDSARERSRLDTTVLNHASDIATQTPFLAVLGNHEYGDISGASDPQQFMAQAKDRGLQMPGRYYHYELNAPTWSADLIAVDSSVLAADPMQQQWIADTVAESLDKEAMGEHPRWRIMISHHPLQSYGYHGQETDYLQTVLAEPLKACDLFLAGHEHDIQLLRGQPGRIPLSLICGTSSESRPVDGGKASLYRSSAPGYARLDLGHEKMKLNIYELHSAAESPESPEKVERTAVHDITRF